VAKVQWYGDWQFMYAGTPSNLALVIEDIEVLSIDHPEALSRRHLQETVLRAYQMVRSRLASFRFLSPFDMTMEEFKQNGAPQFGEKFHDDLLRSISNEGERIQDQLLVTGWGLSPLSAMVYEVGPSGDLLHTHGGFGAIGTGAEMAYTMLMLLGQARHRTLAETIFSVACAKFFSEKSRDLDVGKMTTICVSRRRAEKDDPKKLCCEFVSLDDVEKLRRLWEAHLKPRIPDEARIEITGIAARVNDGAIRPLDMLEDFKARVRLDEKFSSIRQADEPDPQSTKDDSSGQRPSPESPGESDES
jgi:hypothetical protein